MFCTLKSTQHGGNGSAFEVITTPSFRNREGKLAKVACMTCRSSKLKCSADPNGCVRCMAKKIKCIYPSIVRGNIQKKVAPSLPSPSPSPPQSYKVEAQQPSMAAQGSAEQMFVNFSSNLDITMCNEIGPGDSLDLDLDSPAPNCYPPVSGLVEHQQKPWDETYQAFWNETMEQDALAPGTHQQTCSVPSSTYTTPGYAFSQAETATSADNTCSCYIKAMEAFEAVNVAIWYQKQRDNDLNHVLQQQKKSLNDCETLLQCATCRSEPAFIMLLLSICGKIKHSINQLNRYASSDATQAPASSYPQPDEGRHSRASSQSQFSSSSPLNQWQCLDDDDESVVMLSLVKVRQTKLEKLLMSIDRTLSAKSLPAHKSFLRDIRA